jgi:predicted SnoaL-like aldol condensation-catalyzing enzyme
VYVSLSLIQKQKASAGFFVFYTGFLKVKESRNRPGVAQMVPGDLITFGT